MHLALRMFDFHLFLADSNLRLPVGDDEPPETMGGCQPIRSALAVAATARLGARHAPGRTHGGAAIEAARCFAHALNGYSKPAVSAC